MSEVTLKAEQSFEDIAKQNCITVNQLLKVNPSIPQADANHPEKYANTKLTLPQEANQACLSQSARRFSAAATQQYLPLQYPLTKTVDHVDHYKTLSPTGDVVDIDVPDPYRWLEGDYQSQDIQAWITAQNGLTRSYLDRISNRDKIEQRLSEIYRNPGYSSPFPYKEFVYFYNNVGKDQTVLYRQKIDGSEAPEVVLDPNEFSQDGTTRLLGFKISEDGKSAAYAISRGGSDWEEFYVLDLTQKDGNKFKTKSDHLEYIKFSDIAWSGNKGFFYSRYPAQDRSSTAALKNHSIYYHEIGKSQSEDKLVYEDKTAGHEKCLKSVETTQDGRFAILSVSGRTLKKKGSAIFYLDLTQKETTFRPILPDFTDNKFELIGSNGSQLLFRTDRGSPNGKIVAIDPKNPGEKNWKTLVAERSDEPIRNASTAGGKLFVQHLQRALSTVEVYDLSGKFEKQIPLPGKGVLMEEYDARWFNGTASDRYVYYAFSNLASPPEIYRYDIQTGQSESFYKTKINKFDPTKYEFRQVSFRSADGTEVYMSIAHKKGIKLDGKNPALITGYGSHGSMYLPSFQEDAAFLMEQGFVYARVYVRGGGEFGENWHEQARTVNKRKSYEDYIGAAEWLRRNHYTSAEKLSMMGGSSAGLATMAVANMRPDLFRAVVPMVGTLDLLRFKQFTLGANWVYEYGDADVPAEFKALYAISPLHNIQTGVKYPAMFFTTADHDDRVPALHTFKTVATAQTKVSKERPVLVRIDTNSGHGASSIGKAVKEGVDVYGFLFRELGVRPKF